MVAAAVEVEQFAEARAGLAAAAVPAPGAVLRNKAGAPCRAFFTKA